MCAGTLLPSVTDPLLQEPLAVGSWVLLGLERGVGFTKASTLVGRLTLITIVITHKFYAYKS